MQRKASQVFDFIGLTEGEHEILDQINCKTVIFLRSCQCAGISQRGDNLKPSYSSISCNVGLRYNDYGKEYQVFLKYKNCQICRGVITIVQGNNLSLIARDVFLDLKSLILFLIVTSVTPAASAISFWVTVSSFLRQ